MGTSDDGARDEQYDSHRLGYNPQVQDGGYDPQLENVRMESIRKIRGRFEHIYQKYGKDFEGVADEIDMETGVIVVNNGHLQNMEHEVDAGNGDALALSRTFEDDEDDVDDEDGSGSSDSEDGNGNTGGDESNSVSSDNPELDFSWQDDTAASLTSPDEDGDILPNPYLNQPSTPIGSKRRKGKERMIPEPSNSDSSSDDIFGRMPAIKDSMLALKDKYQNGQEMAPDDIQALGMTIANQLASFITGGNNPKKLKRQTLPARFESVEASRGRTRHRSHSPVNPVAPTPGRSPGSKSLWAPMQRPGRRRGPRKQKAAAPTTVDKGDDSLVDSIVLQTIMDQSALEPDELQGPTTVRCCSNCKTTETLTWRRGPKAVDLCNNCGMYYYRYGLMRPMRRSPQPRLSPTPPEGEVVGRRKPAHYSANTSRPLDGINLFGMQFSAREDAQIIKLKEIDGMTWDQIAMEHPGRTPYALQCRYSKMLHGKPCEARDILSSRGYQFYIDSDGNTVARRPGEFTEEENDLLLKLREEDGLDWDAVALALPGRTAEDVENRFDEMAAELLGEEVSAGFGKRKAKPGPKPKPELKQKRRDSNASNGSRARYTPAEDDTILRLREDDKLGWQDIAKQMPGRTLASVQRHYSRDIGPYGRSRSSTPRGSPGPDELPSRPRKYTEDEDTTLMRLRDDEGLEWEQVAEQMPDRSASSLENRYYYKVRNDESRPSSRASSVAWPSGRHDDDALPAVALEAQLDGVQNEASLQEDSFTPAEDALIVKLRELECLSWEQIALEMPGRDVSSISCRYYQHLLPAKVPEVRETRQTSGPSPQSNGIGRQAAVSQDELAVSLLEGSALQNTTSDSPLPTSVLSSRSAGLERTSKLRKSDGTVPSQRRSVVSRRSDPPMLRRALQKNLNRRAEPAKFARSSLPDPSTMTDGANDGALADVDELCGLNHDEPGLLPSALPIPPVLEPPTSERELRSSSKKKLTYPETPLRRMNGSYPTSDPTPADHVPYITPSRYQAQSHPYFVPNAEIPELAEPEPETDPPRATKRATKRRAITVEHEPVDELEEGIFYESEGRPSRKRRRAPAPTRSVGPKRMQVRDTEEEDEMEDFDDDDDIAGEYFTSRKTKKGMNDAQRSFSGRKPAALARKDNVVEPSAGPSVTPPAEMVDETEEEDIEMPDLGTDDDESSSSSSEEEEDDDELRCKPRQRSPLFDPRNTIDEAKKKKEAIAMARDKTAVARAGDGTTMLDINPEYDVSRIPPEHLTRPDLSWTQLNFMALRSRAPEPMWTREIYAYLEEQFPFFRFCRGHWRDSIRGNLSTRSEFKKHTDAKTAQWCLADPEQEAIVMPKGKRRGRVPMGAEREGKVKMRGKGEEKRARGRPSNASKGLPLKRAYTRKYVPAAEKRRLAAAEDGKAVQVVRSEPTVEGAATSSAELEIEPVNLTAGKDNIEVRPPRPSTIEDSDASDRFAFGASLPSDPAQGANDEIKYEDLQLPEPAFTAPTAPMGVTSDINREPESSDAAPVAELAISINNGISPNTTPIYLSTITNRGLRSSSPALSSGSTGPHLSRTYGRATPGTARSSLSKQLVPAPVSVIAVGKASPAYPQVARAERAGTRTPSILRRTVETSEGEGDGEGSEDELA